MWSLNLSSAGRDSLPCSLLQRWKDAERTALQTPISSFASSRRQSLPLPQVLEETDGTGLDVARLDEALNQSRPSAGHNSSSRPEMSLSLTLKRPDDIARLERAVSHLSVCLTPTGGFTDADLMELADLESLSRTPAVTPSTSGRYGEHICFPNLTGDLSPFFRPPVLPTALGASSGNCLQLYQRYHQHCQQQQEQQQQLWQQEQEQKKKKRTPLNNRIPTTPSVSLLAEGKVSSSSSSSRRDSNGENNGGSNTHGTARLNASQGPGANAKALRLPPVAGKGASALVRMPRKSNSKAPYRNVSHQRGTSLACPRDRLQFDAFLFEDEYADRLQLPRLWKHAEY